MGKAKTKSKTNNQKLLKSCDVAEKKNAAITQNLEQYDNYVHAKVQMKIIRERIIEIVCATSMNHDIAITEEMFSADLHVASGSCFE